MTTTITIKAAHWDVSVISIDLKTGKESAAPTVAKGEHRDFFVHSGQDLRIHEIQADEAKAEDPSAD